jgi:hypothetical protein
MSQVIGALVGSSLNDLRALSNPCSHASAKEDIMFLRGVFGAIVRG